jgi:dienelactone hydrolase
MNRTALVLLAVALTIALAFLLATFERADRPAPGRGGSSSATDQPAADRADPATRAGVEIRDDGLVATWFAPPDGAPRAALLVLGGSEGGKATSMALAEALHREGHATLALAYFGADGLPDQLKEIPLAYFERALEWLSRQPGVDPARIGVIGGSKGAEAALLLASRDLRVRAVVAFAPTDHAWQSVDWNAWSDTPSWTEGGMPVPYLRYAPFDARAGIRAMYDRSLADATPAALDAARIPVERSDAALLLIAGGADGLWGAVEASRRIAATLATAGHPHPVEVLEYPDAGHVVYLGGPIADDDPRLDQFLAMGGTRAGIVAAINDAWPRSLAFLARHLSPAQATPAARPAEAAPGH